MNFATAQAGSQEGAEKERAVNCKTNSPRHIRQGLGEELARALHAPRKRYTTRAVAQDNGVRQDVVVSAALHFSNDRLNDLYKKVERLERILNAGPTSPSGAAALYLVRKAA